MAELFGEKTPTINYHLKEVFDSGELTPGTTIRKIRIVQREGNREVTREIELYNLDAVISVGYRVNSTQAYETKENSRPGRLSVLTKSSRSKKRPRHWWWEAKNAKLPIARLYFTGDE